MNNLLVICRTALLGFIVMISVPAWADHFVDDPCALPADVQKAVPASASLVHQRARLVEKGDQLDEVITRFNGRCKQGHASGSDAELACAEAETTLNNNLDAHDHLVAQFNRDLTQALTSGEAPIVARMAKTRTKLANARVDTDRAAARAAEWVSMGQAEARRARWTLFEQTVLFGVDKYTEAAHENAALSEQELREFKTWYKESWQAFPPEVRATIENQITTMRSFADVAVMLKYIYEQHARVYEVVESLEKERMMEATEKATLGVLKLSLNMMKNVSPQVKATVAVAETSAAGVDSWHAYYIAKDSVDQMLSLRDLDLRAIASLADLYRRDTDRLKVMRATAAECHASQ